MPPLFIPGWSRLRAVLTRGQIDDDIRRECEEHLELLAARNKAAGMSDEEARHAAHRQFGNTTRVREDIYHMNSLQLLESLWQDVRYGLRSLRGAPLFTVASVLTIAVGIGATTSIFSTVNATLLRPLPYNRPGELVSVRTRFIDGRATSGLVSYAELASLRSIHDSVAHAGAFGAPFDAALIRPDGTPVNVIASGVTDGFFEALEMPLQLGRSFAADEHRPGRNLPLNVVLSSRAWSTYFGSDPGIIGKTIRIAELRAGIIVVGVAPPQFDLPHDTDVWFNMRLAAADETHFLDAVARLKPGATLEQLRAAAPSVMSTLGETIPTAAGRQFVAQSLVAATVGDLRPILLIVLAATLLLLALACVNVANLLLSRGMLRAREFALRAALGASQTRVIRQLLIESMLLATAGAIAGVALAWWLVRLLLLLGLSKLPRLDAIPIDSAVLWFAFVILLLTGLVVGIAPAWQLSRTDGKSLLDAGGRTMTSTVATSRTMSALIVAEIALAIAVVCGAGWLVQSYSRLRTTELGFNATNRLIIDTRPARMFARGADANAWWDQALAAVRAAVGDLPVGLSTSFPLRPISIDTANVEIATDLPDPTQVRTSHFQSVSPDFFRAMGIRMITGRPFTDDDRLNTEPVAIVNRMFVKHFLGEGDAIGQVFAYGFPAVDRQAMPRIVGVIEDVRSKNVFDEAESAIYVPRAQRANDFPRAPIVVDGRGRSIEDLKEAIQAALTRFDPLVIVRFTAATQVVDDATNRQELGMTMMLIFGATALLLAAVGVYGVIAYTVSQRGAEIATRIVFGASRRQVFWLLMQRGLKLAALGLVAGVGLAYAGGRVVASSVFEMRAADPIVLAVAGLVVISVAIVAITIPSARATRLSPARMLRSD